MAGKYGHLHQAADLIKRAIPKSGSGPFSDLLVHQFVELLQTFDAVQQDNLDFTLALQTGGAIRVIFRGVEMFGLQPHASHIRFGTRIEPLHEDHAKLLALIEQSSTAFENRIDSPLWFLGQWRCGKAEIDLIQQFVTELPIPILQHLAEDVTHPRQFPGEVRQWALETFEREGSMCPGVGRGKHRVQSQERIEFDHVLPYSRGGSSSFGNIQVLCQECNRRKRDNAL